MHFGSQLKKGTGTLANSRFRDESDRGPRASPLFQHATGSRLNYRCERASSERLTVRARVDLVFQQR
jgi:hypothetical protein